jgi:hypothetical protein
MDKVYKPSNSECRTTSSEPFRIYLCNRYGLGIYPFFRKLECLNIQIAETFNHTTFFTRCKSQCILQTVLYKTPVNSRRSSRIDQRVSKALLRDRIQFQWHNKASQIQKIQQL